MPLLSDTRARAWLSKRQIEVVGMAQACATTKAAAEGLGVSATTIRKHLRRARATIERMEAAVAE